MNGAEAGTMDSVVVTGVSTGIGQAIARDLARAGFFVFGGVRRIEDAAALAAECGAAFAPLVFDVTDDRQVAAAAAQVAERLGGEPLWGLVNNAGIAVPGPLRYVPLDAVRQQLEVNVIGVLRVTRAFLPLMLRAPLAPRGRGRVVNMSSVSGRFASPFFGPYAASKHALEAISDSWRRELLPQGVDVVTIEPGHIRTPIWEKAADLSPYRETEYGAALARLKELVSRRAGLPPEAVSRVVVRALTRRRPRTRYVVSDNVWLGWYLPRVLPDRWFDALAASRLRMRGVSRGSRARDAGSLEGEKRGEETGKKG
jgi:NAD(P)-dependent dehydrogenase (short-subunit alcohol dehydrogenase family)